MAKIFNFEFYRGGANLILPTLFLFLSFNIGFTQTDFFTTISDADALNDNELVSMKAIVDNNPAMYIESSFGELKDISDLITETETFTITLPGEEPLTLHTSLINRESTHGDLIWAGQSLNKTSYMAYIQKGTQKAAIISHRNKSYQITQTKTSGKHILTRRVNPLDVACGNTNVIPPNPGPDDGNYCDDVEEDNCIAIVDVLFLITSDDLVDYETTSNMPFNFYIGFQESLTNLAFANSAIQNKRIRISSLVIDSFISAADPTDSLHLQLTDEFANLRNVFPMSFREQYNADLVFLLRNQNYTDPFGAGVVGAASPQIAQGNPHATPNPNGAYSFFNMAFPITELVFQHELGHLFGGFHNWISTAGDSFTFNCWHAKRHFDKVTEVEAHSWGTILRRPLSAGAVVDISLNDPFSNAPQYEALLILSSEPILHYSNPDVFYNGESTGEYDDMGFPLPANNARRIKDSACPISNFVNTSGSTNFEVAIIEPEPCGTTYNVDISEATNGGVGFPPYYTTWELSTTGTLSNGQSIVGSYSPSLDLTQITFPHCQFWIQVTVVSSDGFSHTETVFADFEDCDCTPNGPIGREKMLAPKKASNFKVYPNPVSGRSITIESLSSGKHTINLFATNGQLVYNNTIKLERNTYSLYLPELAEGLYILELIDSEGKTFKEKLKIRL